MNNIFFRIIVPPQRASIVLILVIIMNASCSTTDPPQQTEKPPGYQEEISWPSLTDSPWPISHGDPQSTGRSKYSGPALGEVSLLTDSFYVKSGVTIDGDSTLYFCSVDPKNEGLCAVDKYGKLKWRISEIGNTWFDTYVTPTIASDGTIYFASWDWVCAASPQGELLWKYNTGSNIWYSMIGLGKDGTIYCVTKTPKLLAISKTGELEWELYDSRFHPGGWICGITFSPDGNTIYVPGLDVTVLAVDIDTKSVKWTFGETELRGSPLIDSQGNCYIQSKVTNLNNGKPSLYSLNPDGSVRWSYVHNNPLFYNFGEAYTEGTMDKYGNYYFAMDTLYSIDYNGNLRWKKALYSRTSTPLISDYYGNIYIIVDWANDDIGDIICFDSDGSIIWQTFINERTGPTGSPAISNDNKIFLPPFKNYKFFEIR